MSAPAREANPSVNQLGHSIATHERYFHSLRLALPWHTQGYLIDGGLVPQAGEALPNAESQGTPLAEVMRDVHRRYRLCLHLREGDDLNVLNLCQRTPIVVAPLFLPETGAAYGRLGEAASYFLFRMEQPARAYVCTDPADEPVPPFYVYGPGDTVPLPSWQLSYDPPLVYMRAGEPARLGREVFPQTIGLFLAVCVLVEHYPYHRAGDMFARALTCYLQTFRWSQASIRLMVSCIAAYAGDHDMSQAALEGRLITAGGKDEDEVTDELREWVGPEASSMIFDEFSPDPRMDRRWGSNDSRVSIAFAAMIEGLERDEHARR